MKFLKVLFFILVSLIVLLLIIAAIMPSERSIERSVVIEKSPAVVFPLVADLNNWEHWSPWIDMDPEAEYITTEPSSGLESRQDWKGDEIGTGYLLTKEYSEGERVLFDLVFDEHSDTPNQDEWTFEEVDGGTKVTWNTHLKLDYPLGRIFGLFVEGMLGPQKENGLAKLKEYAMSLKEKPVNKFEIVEVEAKPMYYVSGSADMNSDDISKMFKEAYGKLQVFCAENNIQMTDAPIAITTNYEEGKAYEFQAALIVDRNDVKPNGDINSGMTYTGKALKAAHIGPYDTLTDTYTSIMSYIMESNLEINGYSWEQYVSDPGNTPEDELVTFIYFPVK